MSKIVNNIIAISGRKRDVIKFFNDGLKSQGISVNNIVDDITTGKISKLTMRSWVPSKETEDFQQDVLANLAELGVKYDTEIVSWECIKDKDEHTVVCGYLDTTPDYPAQWIKTILDSYETLDIGVFTVDEYYENVGYMYDEEWIEKIRMPINAKHEQITFFHKEINALKDRFFSYITE